MADVYLALIVFFGLREVYGARVKDYCQIKCREGVHTMCTKYYPPGGSNCSDYKVSITAKEMYEIIEDVNQWRNSVALGKLYGLPSASNMIELQWDDEAASIATRWAEQCDQVKEDDCRRMLMTSRDDGGQCISSTAGKGHKRSQVLRELMEYFFTMGNNMTNIPNSIDVYRPTADEVKYFTQMAWALTDRIGCAISVYKMADGDAKYKLICNLYAAGNIPERAVYLRGEPCSACPAMYSQCSNKYRGLCTYKPKAPSRSSHLQFLIAGPLSFPLILSSFRQKILCDHLL